jgi:hypothetical protein
MAKIEVPTPGQHVWLLENGSPCERIYLHRARDNEGHILQIPGIADDTGRYYEAFILAYEKKSDLLQLRADGTSRMLLRVLEKASQDPDSHRSQAYRDKVLPSFQRRASKAAEELRQALLEEALVDEEEEPA